MVLFMVYFVAYNYEPQRLGNLLRFLSLNVEPRGSVDWKQIITNNIVWPGVQVFSQADFLFVIVQYFLEFSMHSRGLM